MLISGTPKARKTKRLNNKFSPSGVVRFLVAVGGIDRRLFAVSNPGTPGHAEDNKTLRAIYRRVPPCAPSPESVMDFEHGGKRLQNSANLKLT